MSAERQEGAPRVLLVDNYDSFTYNLSQYLAELGAEVEVYRNDRITLDEIEEMNPDKIVLSPGPCSPKEAGISVDVVKRFGERIPLLGVCLGHQCIGEAYGAVVDRAGEIVHGKTSMIRHKDVGIFAGLPNPFKAIRYHSLVILPETVPSELEITATTANKLVMGIRHREYPIQGVQFHPESIFTPQGKRLLRNFLRPGYRDEERRQHYFGLGYL
ncbi:MAG: anthranilate synthase component II [Microgenomates group bacterium Gr01-1014_7]|nr:MAG: anthranilate synthase component II [Microgenomates group bacterium Gr01-1014_7]